MIKIKDAKNKKKYEDLIAKSLMFYWNRMIFGPVSKILSQNIKAANDNSLILEGLKQGSIFYQDGYFKSLKSFSNDVSLQFKNLGAKWDKYEKGFSFVSMPDWLQDVVVKMEVIRTAQLQQISGYLQDLQLNLNHYIDEMIFNTDVEQILDETNKDIQANGKRINIIVPDLNKQQVDNIARDYTKNMQYYVKKWTSESIISMRQQVQDMVLNGLREDSVKKVLQTQYTKELKESIKKNKPKNLSQKELNLWYKRQKKRFLQKAKFLAQNETSILLAQYKRQVYTEMGFEEFIWNTIMDTHERQLHAELNGKIFRFDNPPIIDERTGQRGLPGETYNCRCGFIPIRRDSVFNV